MLIYHVTHLKDCVSCFSMKTRSSGKLYACSALSFVERKMKFNDQKIIIFLTRFSWSVLLGFDTNKVAYELFCGRVTVCELESRNQYNVDQN